MFEYADEELNFLWFCEISLSYEVMFEFHRYTLLHIHKYIYNIAYNYENIFFGVLNVDG